MRGHALGLRTAGTWGVLRVRAATRIRKGSVEQHIEGLLPQIGDRGSLFTRSGPMARSRRGHCGCKRGRRFN